MDAKMFGAFLAQVRRAQSLTQAELAEQLHVTDKAVSRWERGVGLPDINTLEPLADALGLSLADLMHCHDPGQGRASGRPCRTGPSGGFLFHVAPPAYRGLAFGPRCAAPAKYRPGTVGHIRLPRNTCSSLAFPQRWFFTSRWLDVLVGRFSASGRNGISHAGTLEQL